MSLQKSLDDGATITDHEIIAFSFAGRQCMDIVCDKLRPFVEATLQRLQGALEASESAARKLLVNSAKDALTGAQGALQKVQGGGVDGAHWAADLGGEISFAALAKHAEQTLMKSSASDLSKRFSECKSKCERYFKVVDMFGGCMDKANMPEWLRSVIDDMCIAQATISEGILLSQIKKNSKNPIVLKNACIRQLKVIRSNIRGFPIEPKVHTTLVTAAIEAENMRFVWP